MGASRVRWFHFRWRTLLVVPLALAVLAAFYVPRQHRQQRALAGLKQRQAIVRTDPLALPLAAELLGPEYTQEIIEVYLPGPRFGDSDLALLEGPVRASPNGTS